MKKNLFILAGLAIAAMSACTKTESLIISQNEAQISFKPLTAKVTKASYITDETIKDNPNGFTFSVYAWYHQDRFASDNAVVEYMSDVPVTYEASIDDGSDPNHGGIPGSGAWVPAATYYWPKNGTLTFDAYAPTSASGDGKFSSTAAEGLVFEDYTVQNLEKQYDLLYSTRTYDKKTSTGGSNATYDGVDIVFNHALSAVEVKVLTADDYSGAIKINNISILDAQYKGTFKQNLVDGQVDASNPRAWTNHEGNVNYVLFNEENGAELTTEGLTGVSNAIVLPQSLKHTDGSKVAIKIDYSIKYGKDKWLAQTNTFELQDCTFDSDNFVNLEKWEIGKKYTYTLKFTLDKVYFAPSVNRWEDVNIGNIIVD